jgi:hypothetical protein
MAYAVNYVGHYLVPGNWISHPKEVTCSGKRDATDSVRADDKRAPCHPNEITVTATCDINKNIEIKVDLGPNNYIPGIDKVIYL